MNEKPEDLRKWFLSEVEKLWPISGGSLSLRKNRCIRPNWQMCRSGGGHPAYALHFRFDKRQTSIYVPDDLVEHLETAIENRKKLQTLVLETGRRYLAALKSQRKGK